MPHITDTATTIALYHSWNNGGVQPVERIIRIWVVFARGVDGMGEADSARCPVNILPAERVCQGWQTPVLQAQQDFEAPQAVVKSTWTY
jgi:hypothetical protein